MKNNYENKLDLRVHILRKLLSFLNKHIENFLLWIWILLLITAMVSVIGISINEKGLKLELSKEGFNTFFDIYSSSVKFLAGFIAILAAWLTVKRIKQTQEQLDIMAENIRNQTEQIFNDKFSWLVKCFDEILDYIQKSKSTHTIGSKEPTEIIGFGELFDFYKSLYDETKESRPNLDEIALIKLSYESFYKFHNTLFSHFYDTTIFFIKCIEESKIKDKEFYINIIISRFLGYETGLLFYHYLSDESNNEFKTYVNKYNFLRNLKDAKLIKDEHIKFYQPIK
jgi:hypothetical protein